MDRLEKARLELKRMRVPVGIVLKPENIYYLSGFYPSSSAALILGDDPEVLITPMDSTRAGEEIPFRVVEKFSTYLKKIEAKRVGVEKNFISYDFYRRYLKKKSLVDLRFIGEMRKVKQKSEVKLIKEGCRITHRAMKEVQEGSLPRTERELAAEIEYRIGRRAEAAFKAIVASGRNSANPHHTPGGDRIDRKALLFDAGARVHNYCSDLSRSCTLSGNKIQEDWSGIVEEAQKAGIRECRPGKRGEEVDVAIRRILRGYGVEEYFLHSSGHGVGLEVHEPPRLGRDSKEELLSGAVVTVEPGIYKDIGVRLEDVVLVGRNPKVISR